MFKGEALSKLVTRRNLTIAWAVLFSISMVLPAIKFNQIESRDPADIWNGFETLLLGWIGVLLMQPAWLANCLLLPLLACAWFRKWTVCGILATITLLLALTSYYASGMVVPRDDGGVQHLRIGKLQIGFYFWVSSFAVWLAAFARPCKESAKPTQTTVVNESGD